jgi:hypothetical protein
MGPMIFITGEGAALKYPVVKDLRQRLRAAGRRNLFRNRDTVLQARRSDLVAYLRAVERYLGSIERR